MRTGTVGVPEAVGHNYELDGGWTICKSARHEVRVHVKEARFVYEQSVKEVDG